MSPNSQYKIESSDISIIQPSLTIDKITPLKGDVSTATAATMDDNQQPIATMTPIMSGTMPPEGEIIESPPQTPTEDTTTEAPDENPSPGFDEFLSILHGDDKSTPAKSSAEDAAVEEESPSKEESPAKDTDHDDDSVEKWEPLPTMEAKSPSENGDVQGTSDDTKSVEEDEPKSPPVPPNNETSIKEDEQSGDDNVETSPEEKGGEVEKAETNETSNNDNNNSDKKEGNPSRRRSSELRNEMGTLLNSVNTVDSWGNKEGSLPPLAGTKQSSMPQFATTSKELGRSASEISDLDEDVSDQSEQPQDKKDRSKSWNPPSTNGEDVANFVNIAKLEPGSSQYYYTPANRKNRQVLEKIGSTRSLKKKKDTTILDDSSHSKASILTERSRRSSYRGPTPLKKDGSVVRGIMRNQSSYHSNDGRSRDALSSADSLPSPEKEKVGGLRRCSFSSVDIREHERVAGDNPCVTSGVPLSIGWGYYQHDSISLDDYEFNRGPPRDKIEMMVPAGIRRQMLRDEFDVTIAEINASMREVNVTKRHRRHTVATEHMEGWSEVVQSAKRKFGRFAKKTSTKKEEEKMWERAHKQALSEYLSKNGEGSLGKNPQSAGAGSINKGPRIVSEENGGEVPPAEISFQEKS